MLFYCLFNHSAKIHNVGPLSARWCINTEKNVIPASLFPFAFNLLSYLVVSCKRMLRPTHKCFDLHKKIAWYPSGYIEFLLSCFFFFFFYLSKTSVRLIVLL